ncbi:MAG: type II toxin-antitoxin system RelE/ParE family toxin [Candidatus Gracilibacteria bacterium]|nr:type II toxin-antitoxin system RelE/ParE family toxin [Candidatus Gracilibacteria bacterium]
MEYTVIFSLDAQNDLKEISDYIERETYSIDMSNKVIGEIVTGAYILQIFPYMYQKVYKEFHCLTIKNNRIFY